MEYIIFKSTCVYRIVCVGYPPKNKQHLRNNFTNIREKFNLFSIG